MGSILAIFPDPDRELSTFRLYHPEPSPEDAIRRYWVEVGGFLWNAMETGEQEWKADEQRRARLDLADGARLPV
jgi:hypothetical protein